MSFIPAFVIFTWYLLLGEVLNLWGVLGVLFIAAGGYVLSIALAKSAYMLAVDILSCMKKYFIPDS